MDSVSYAQAQDDLRPWRMFVGALNGAVAGSFDQTYAGYDYAAYNSPYRFQSIGPYGAAVEGAGMPIAATSGGGLYISPMVVLIGLGAAAVLLLKR